MDKHGSDILYRQLRSAKDFLTYFNATITVALIFSDARAFMCCAVKQIIQR